MKVAMKNSEVAQEKFFLTSVDLPGRHSDVSAQSNESPEASRFCIVPRPLFAASLVISLSALLIFPSDALARNKDSIHFDPLLAHYTSI